MRLTVIGASAGTGLEVVRHALAQGHQVRALARRPIPLADRPNLIRSPGDARREEDVRRAVTDADAVIVALGNGMNLARTTLFSEAATVLIDVLKDVGPTVPVVVLSGFGARESLDFIPSPFRFLFKLLLGRVYADKNEAEARFEASGLRWTVVRPGTLTNRPARGAYRVLPTLTPAMRVGSISRADVARFMVGEAERPAHTGTFPVLTD